IGIGAFALRSGLCHADKVGLLFHRGGIPPSTMERIMKTSRSVLVAAALAVGTAAPAVGGGLDPEVIIYRFAGVRDSGSADNAGVATVFHCTNFSNDIQNIRFVTRQSNGNLLQNTFSSVAIFGSVTLSTHRTAAYDENDSLQTGPVNQGTTAI